MKLIHLSDLHLGKRVNEFSMLEEQKYMLQQLLQILDQEAPQGVIIAGDVYDKPVPPAEAVALFDDFLVALSKRHLPVYIISGNHDSPERLAFGGRLLEHSEIYVSPVYNGQVTPISIQDEWGIVDIFLLPFVKPAHVRRAFPEADITDETTAILTAIAHMDVDASHRSVLVAHQFVTGAARCESEEISVGGTDNVDASVFAPFDYVALGHLHGPQNIYVGEGSYARYCGTLLKYSFSECSQKKSVTVVELGDKGEVDIREILVHPRHDLVEIRGSFAQIMSPQFQKDYDCQDYMHITLTDEEDIPGAIGKLRQSYPNIMRLDYDNARTRNVQNVEGAADVEKKTPLQLFQELYQLQNNQPMSEEQEGFTLQLMEKIWEGRS